MSDYQQPISNPQNQFSSPMIEVKTMSSPELARLISVQNDLKFVIKSTEALINLLNEEDYDHVLAQSLYIASVVTYCRCFSKGKRSPLTAEIFSDQPKQALECHEYFKHMRDKHIAHSVNRFEAVKIGVMLVPEGMGARGVLGFGYYNTSRMTDGAENVRMLQQLAEYADHKLFALGKEIEALVKAEVAEISLDSLYQQGPATYIAPGMQDASIARDDMSE